MFATQILALCTATLATISSLLAVLRNARSLHRLSAETAKAAEAAALAASHNRAVLDRLELSLKAYMDRLEPLVRDLEAIHARSHVADGSDDTAMRGG